MGIGSFEHFFQSHCGWLLGDYVFHVRLRKGGGGGELVGVSDNLCLHEKGLFSLISGSFMASLPSGTMVKSRCRVKWIKQIARRRSSAKVAFRGSRVWIARAEMSRGPGR